MWISKLTRAFLVFSTLPSFILILRTYKKIKWKLKLLFRSHYNFERDPGSEIRKRINIELWKLFCAWSTKLQIIRRKLGLIGNSLIVSFQTVKFARVFILTMSHKGTRSGCTCSALYLCCTSTQMKINMVCSKTFSMWYKMFFCTDQNDFTIHSYGITELFIL